MTAQLQHWKSFTSCTNNGYKALILNFPKSQKLQTIQLRMAHHAYRPCALRACQKAHATTRCSTSASTSRRSSLYIGTTHWSNTTLSTSHRRCPTTRFKSWLSSCTKKNIVTSAKIHRSTAFATAGFAGHANTGSGPTGQIPHRCRRYPSTTQSRHCGSLTSTASALREPVCTSSISKVVRRKAQPTASYIAQAGLGAASQRAA